MNSGPASALPFNLADQALLQALARHNAQARAVLCTLARRGAAMRRDEAARADAWLAALAPHPYYKGGQFLFDLLEWEDFMLDGEPPPLLDEAELLAALGRAATVLRAFALEVRGAAGEGAGDSGPGGEPAAAPDAERATKRPSRRVRDKSAWPALAGNAYLYPEVVLGAIAALTRTG